MAVEIKEVVIKAVLTDGKNESKSVDSSVNDKEEMIQTCVDQVLKILQKKNLR